MSWSRVITQTLVILGAGLALVILGLGIGQSSLTILGWIVVAVSALWMAGAIARAIAEKVLWRVGRRLLVSYLLLGLLPFPLLLLLIGTVSWVLSGQLAVRRVETEISTAVDAMAVLARDLDAELAGADDGEQMAKILDRPRPNLPGIGLAYLPDSWPTPREPARLSSRSKEAGLGGEAAAPGALGAGPVEAGLILPSDRVYTRLEAIGILRDGRHFLAHVRPTAHGTIATYLMVEPDLRAWIHRRTQVAVTFPEDKVGPGEQVDSIELSSSRGLRVETRPRPDPATADGEGLENASPENTSPSTNSPTVTISDDEGNSELDTFLDRPVSTGFGGLADRPFVVWLRSLEMAYVDWQEADWHSAIEGQTRPFPFVVWTSLAREYVELFGTHSADDTNLDFARIARRLVQGVGIATLVLYALASALAGFLVFRIARATRRFHEGFVHVEAGHFDHRIRMRGNDQLAALGSSFNRMAEHLEQATTERAERKALDRELRLARELQQNLLPSPEIQTPGFELAIDFRPAAAVGGDFYQLLPRQDGSLAVVIADVSGHGLATGIVMSAAQSVLSVLAEDEEPADELLDKLNRQLRTIVGQRTFVTLVHALFEAPPSEPGAASRVEVTAAGHLPPYRVAVDGKVSTVGAPAPPLGVGLKSRFTPVEATTQEGDLWILLSDGVIEATNGEGEMFGFDRFEALLERCAGLRADAARDLLLGAWRRFTASDLPEDDRTLLVLRVGDTLQVREASRPQSL